MKIEKLTENKIRVIIHQEELGLNQLNVSHLMTKAIETQDIFWDILKKAEKEVDFHTDGCKLLIEAFSSLEDVVVFTITKFLPDTTANFSDTKKKKLVVKRKSFTPTTSSFSIGQFENLDSFCAFCNCLKCIHNLDTSKLAKNISLYLWKDSYYLVLKNVNHKYPLLNLFYSTLSEFGKLTSPSHYFEYKLLEHGKVLLKKNAIAMGITYFC